MAVAVADLERHEGDIPKGSAGIFEIQVSTQASSMVGPVRG